MAGIPPLSGFFAKDQVVAAAARLWPDRPCGSPRWSEPCSRPSTSPGATFMTFFGGPGTTLSSPRPARHGCGSSLIVLAAGAAVGGVLGLSATSGLLPKFLAPVVGGHAEAAEAALPELVLSRSSRSASALAGICLAFLVYLSGRIDWMALRARLGGTRTGAAARVLRRRLLLRGGRGPRRRPPRPSSPTCSTRRVIDGAVNGLGLVVPAAWRAVGRRVQTGFVRSYALAVLLGVVGRAPLPGGEGLSERVPVAHGGHLRPAHRGRAPGAGPAAGGHPAPLGALVVTVATFGLSLGMLGAYDADRGGLPADRPGRLGRAP